MDDFFSVIKNIIYSLVSLFVNIYVLFGYILSAIFIISIIYLLIIRPIFGSIFDKGKRLYWLGLIAVLVFGFIIGPFIIIELAQKYNTIGIIIGTIIYLGILWLIASPGIKKENDENNHSF